MGCKEGLALLVLVRKQEEANWMDEEEGEHEFKVVVKFDATKDIDHLRQFLSGRQRDNPHETNQALDIVLTKAASRERIIVWRSLFSTAFKMDGGANERTCSSEVEDMDLDIGKGSLLSQCKASPISVPQ
ncbi:Argonaute/Dicer protein, PAZ [Artemisia annua]|uniref:Argonaute/Dicer protein, PAZ n=1 Tax=Artemisia annua TaxID=35608 RepID=A0A2U1KQX9_ARTAN|nr:Argonaute/Dicer protein, PAZ [Artemisia annua]